MGDWHISIRGTGQHHNKHPFDANEMAAKFTQELKDVGHSIKVASFLNGADQDLSDTRLYLKGDKND